MHILFKRTWNILQDRSHQFSSVQFISVAQSCPTLCDPMNCSTPGVPVHHQLLEFTQTHVHRVRDAIQPSHPWSSPSPPARQSLPASESFPMSQLFTWGGQSIGVSALASVLPKNTQDWSPLQWTGWISLQSKGLLADNKPWDTTAKLTGNGVVSYQLLTSHRDPCDLNLPCQLFRNVDPWADPLQNQKLHLNTFPPDNTNVHWGLRSKTSQRVFAAKSD